MSTLELMGALALAILWVNALLIAADAIKRAAALLSRRSRLTRAVKGTIARGDGPGGAFAVQRFDQVGRAADDGSRILFHDRSSSAQLFGGAVHVESAVQGARFEPCEPSAQADVWTLPEDRARAAACAATACFEAALVSARKARGFERRVEVVLREGDEVFVAPSFVARVDPRRPLARGAALGIVFAAAEVAVAAGCTALALHAPVFGPVSTIGGALGLLFFLLVQPAGSAVRDAMRLPSAIPLGGSWTSSGS